MGRRVGGILKLAGHKAARGGGGQLVGLLDGAGHAPGAGGQHDLGTEGLQQIAALHAHGVGHGQDDMVPAGGPDGGQTDAGIAAGGFNDGGAGFQLALLLGGVQHGLGHAVLHTAGGVAVFQLGHQGACSAPGRRSSCSGTPAGYVPTSASMPDAILML